MKRRHLFVLAPIGAIAVALAATTATSGAAAQNCVKVGGVESSADIVVEQKLHVAPSDRGGWLRVR